IFSAVAEEINAALVIMGTGGRSGLGVALLGHTAEQVIDKLTSDLLALKQEGFVSQNTLDEEDE
ncbi:universal stress protein, partial [Psychromonas aquatilis]